MTLAAIVILIVTAFVTATLTGVFGMAGGLVLMGVLALLMPVSAAFVTHGLLQLAANGWRAALHRRHVQWRIVGLYALGSAAIGAVAGAIAIAPSKPVLFLLLGLLPILVWIPTQALRLDAARPVQALACGVLVTGLNLTAGVAGPLLDIFFVRTSLTRHQIVATKAATQVFSHLAKVIVFGGAMLGSGMSALPPVWAFLVAIALSLAGTVAGGRILDRMNDADFKRWTRWIVSAIGLGYLVRAAQLFAG